jgi:hypothetical protein
MYLLTFENDPRSYYRSLPESSRRVAEMVIDFQNREEALGVIQPNGGSRLGGDGDRNKQSSIESGQIFSDEGVNHTGVGNNTANPDIFFPF